MPLIKRYPNRKLYDTEAKQYVTLESIAEMIRAGEDVEVIDHESGDDLTSLTLSQIILDQEKKQSGFLPRSLMTNLIRTGGDTIEYLMRSVQKQPMLPDAIEEQMAALVQAGKLSREQAKSVLQALHPFRTESSLDENMGALLNRLNIPSNRDIEELRRKLAELNEQLAELNENEDPTTGE